MAPEEGGLVVVGEAGGTLPDEVGAVAPDGDALGVGSPSIQPDAMRLERQTSIVIDRPAKVDIRGPSLVEYFGDGKVAVRVAVVVPFATIRNSVVDGHALEV